MKILLLFEEGLKLIYLEKFRRERWNDFHDDNLLETEKHTQLFWSISVVGDALTGLTSYHKVAD